MNIRRIFIDRKVKIAMRGNRTLVYWLGSRPEEEKDALVFHSVDSEEDAKILFVLIAKRAYGDTPMAEYIFPDEINNIDDLFKAGDLFERHYLRIQLKTIPEKSNERTHNTGNNSSSK